MKCETFFPINNTLTMYSGYMYCHYFYKEKSCCFGAYNFTNCKTGKKF